MQKEIQLQKEVAVKEKKHRMEEYANTIKKKYQPDISTRKRKEMLMIKNELSQKNRRIRNKSLTPQ